MNVLLSHAVKVETAFSDCLGNEDTSFDIGPNNVSCDIKVDSDKLPLQKKQKQNIFILVYIHVTYTMGFTYNISNNNLKKILRWDKTLHYFYAQKINLPHFDLYTYCESLFGFTSLSLTASYLLHT